MPASFPHLRHFLLLLVLPLAIACSKKADDQPTPTTGSIEGSVSPADGLKTVTATNSGGLTFVATPTTAGTFVIDKLVPGSYALSFDPNSGFVVPANRTISVTAGSATSAGVVVVASDGSIRSGTAGWAASGQTYSTTQVTGAVSVAGQAGNALSLNATARDASGATDAVSLFVGGFTLAPGSYSLVGNTYASASYTRTNSTGQATIYYTSGGAGATGTVTINSYSAATGTLTGTFAFTAPPSSGSGSNLAVTSGTFSVRL